MRSGRRRPTLFATRLAGRSGLMGGALVPYISMLVGKLGRNRSGMWPTHVPPFAAAMGARSVPGHA